MSRGFVKEDDLEHAGTDVPERPVSVQLNYITARGYALLEQLATHLETQRKALSLQKDDATAIAQLVIVNRDLRYVSARLESAIVTKPEPPFNQVVFGVRVTVEDETGKIHTYEIVGEDEADIKAGKISWVSPLAKALIGQKVGDEVTWQRPLGNLVLSILKIGI